MNNKHSYLLTLPVKSVEAHTHKQHIPRPDSYFDYVWGSSHCMKMADDGITADYHRLDDPGDLRIFCGSKNKKRDHRNGCFDMQKKTMTRTSKRDTRGVILSQIPPL